MFGLVPEVGIDLGLTYIIALDDGTKIASPKYYRRSEERLAKAQRKLSGLVDFLPHLKVGDST